MQEYTTFLVSAFVAVFVIVDPFGTIPIYLTLTRHLTEDQRNKARRKGTFIAAAILCTFAIAGTNVFKIFSITPHAFRIAGGILLLSLGFKQLSAAHDRVKKEEELEGLGADDISVFPLATPLLAGPGAMSTVALYATSATSVALTIALLTAIVASFVATGLILRLAPALYKILGQTGLNLFTRLMGIILTSIAVQFIIDGVVGAYQSLPAKP